MARLSGTRREFLFVQSTTEQGGAETVLLNAMESSEELRQRSVIATLGFGTGDLALRLRATGAEVIELHAGRMRHLGGLFRTVRRLGAIAREHGVGVILGNGAHPQVYAGWAARLAGVRAAYLCHMIHRTPLWRNHPVEAVAVRGPLDLVVANSQISLEAVRRLRPRVRYELVYPGTSVVPATPAERQAARAELGIGTEEVLFGVFGRLQRWKGQDVFVDAAGRVAAEMTNARFAVVGGSVFGLEPEFGAALRERAAALGLGARVIFTGHRTDVPRLMAACDVVCHTTRVPEPFGMVVIEAMAQGRAMIATRGGGPSEIVDDGVTGLLTSPGDLVVLADAMLSLGRDAQCRRAMGEAALARVRERFSSEAMAVRLIEVLEGAP